MQWGSVQPLAAGKSLQVRVLSSGSCPGNTSHGTAREPGGITFGARTLGGEGITVLDTPFPSGCYTCHFTESPATYTRSIDAPRGLILSPVQFVVQVIGHERVDGHIGLSVRYGKEVGLQVVNPHTFGNGIGASRPEGIL